METGSLRLKEIKTGIQSLDVAALATKSLETATFRLRFGEDGESRRE